MLCINVRLYSLHLYITYLKNQKMNSRNNKIKKTKNQSADHKTLQKKGSDKSIYQQIDNRPQAIAQRKLQAMTDNRQKFKQLKAIQEMADKSSSHHQNPILKKEDETGLSDNFKMEKESEALQMDYPNRFQNNNQDATLPQVSTNNQQPIVQRKTGVEVELHVPFYKKSPHSTAVSDHFNRAKVKPTGIGASDAEKIVDFMYGGLDYGKSYGKEKGYYDISADHIGFSKIHSKLLDHLLTNKYMIYPGGDFDSMTNMEYRSKEQEERLALGQTRSEEIAKKINDHAVDSASKATSGDMTSLIAPVANLYTGIPVAALKILMTGDATGLGLLAQLEVAITPKLYFQTTTGTLPSEVPDLFQEAADDIKAKDPTNVRAAMLENAIAQTKKTIDSHIGGALLSTLPKGQVKSLQGWMTLVAQYMMAWQMETTSFLYYPNIKTKNLRKRSGTGKNLVAYLSKTHLVDSIEALPDAVKPNIVGGSNKDNWMALFNTFYSNTVQNFNLATKLNLTQHLGDQYYKNDDTEEKKPIDIKHDEIFGTKSPNFFLEHLLKKTKVKYRDKKTNELKEKYAAFHVQTGNALTLDDGQESAAFNPKLTVKGEQAIPLEDRYIHHKDSTLDRMDISTAEGQINAEWTKAKNRRIKSTKERTDLEQEYDRADTFFQGFGNAVVHVAALNTFKLEFDGLSRNPDNVSEEVEKIFSLNSNIVDWQLNNTNESVALALVTPLLQKANWSKIGTGRIPFTTKIPTGISAMQTTLSGGGDANSKINSMALTALERLNKGNRDNTAQKNTYELMRDISGWIINGQAGWNNLIAKLQIADGMV